MGGPRSAAGRRSFTRVRKDYGRAGSHGRAALNLRDTEIAASHTQPR